MVETAGFALLIAGVWLLAGMGAALLLAGVGLIAAGAVIAR